MDTAFMGLTSSRDVTVSRTLSARTSSRRTIFLPTNLAGRQCTHLPHSAWIGDVLTCREAQRSGGLASFWVGDAADGPMPPHPALIA
jgi:hypothetical protein